MGQRIQEEKNGPSKICGRQPLKKLKAYVMLREAISCQII